MVKQQKVILKTTHGDTVTCKMRGCMSKKSVVLSEFAIVISKKAEGFYCKYFKLVIFASIR